MTESNNNFHASLIIVIGYYILVIITVICVAECECYDECAESQSLTGSETKELEGQQKCGKFCRKSSRGG